MSELKLPSQMKIRTEEGEVVVYFAGDNPQPNGSILYINRESEVEVIVNSTHKAVWP
jgi:formylmethanofuran dehydrogenase subunit D